MSSRSGLAQPGGRRGRRLATASVIAAVGIAVAFGATGCGAGQISQTANQLPAVNGNGANLGSLELRDVQIVYPTHNATATFDEGGPFDLSWVIANTSETAVYRLTSVTAPQGQITLKDSYDIRPGQSLRAGSPAALLAPAGSEHGTGQKRITATLEDAGNTVASGLTTKLTFTFVEVKNENGASVTVPAGSVTVDTPVDSGTLLTRQDKVREAEEPADEHDHVENLGQN
ncbi:MAG: hypothetical protein QM673_13185 [Gordonia sp. (in: high G+C Gram-positive bacteria)]